MKPDHHRDASHPEWVLREAREYRRAAARQRASEIYGLLFALLGVAALCAAGWASMP